MLYYSDGGPGPASKLLRVDAEPEGFAQWRAAPASTWQVKGGWQPYPQAQNEILQSGEFFMIDASQVVEVQAQMLAEFVAFH